MARMQVRLAYGTAGLTVDLPAARTTVVTPRFVPGLSDPAAALARALRRPLGAPPLRKLAARGQRVVIAVCDGTRPQPRPAVLRAILQELDGRVRPEDVTVLIATGTHRGNTPAELDTMLGADVTARVRVVNHDARAADSLVWLGTLGAGVPVWLNREWTSADLRITTGVVEPHFFAGFSGGPKMIAPGLAGLETVLALHDARRIGDPRATWGVVEGNPVQDDVRAIADTIGTDFALDVVVNARQEITLVFAGALFAEHAAACDAARAVAMQPVAQRFPVVLTTNAGHPLDQNLYQAVKGMSAAARVVTPGGRIICAAACTDGLPAHGNYARLLAAGETPAALLRRIEQGGATEPDQWQVQIQARIQATARVALKTEGLSADVVRRMHLDPIDDVAGAVAAALQEAGPAATLCVLPEGPQTIPYLP
jgi:nickel-dependent lactate racemase